MHVSIIGVCYDDLSISYYTGVSWWFEKREMLTHSLTCTFYVLQCAFNSSITHENKAAY